MTAAATKQSRIQLCSDISAASGEDPIGSAWHSVRYMMIELPLPWKYDTLESPGVPPGLHDVVHELYAREIYPGLVGFAPDEAWSVAGMTRIIDYVVPTPPFAGFVRTECLVPTDQVASVVRESFLDAGPAALAPFAIEAPPDRRDIFVCTHGAIDACCATYGYPIYKLLRHMAGAENPDRPFRAWRCTHFGGHRFAATMLDMPQGRYWGHLTAHDLGPIVRRDGDVELIRQRYRGWAALPYGGAQVAEGEAFRRGGWAWTECLVRPGEAPPHDFDHGPTEEQRMTFAFRHAARGIDGQVEFAMTPTGTIRTKGTTKGADWIDAPQFITQIVSEHGTQEFFGDGFSSES